MLKKLSDEKIEELLETGISEFAAHGPDKANINVIAKKSGVSVGVLYKYYKSKDNFFQACFRRSLSALNKVLDDVLNCDCKILERAEKLIRAVQNSAKAQSKYNILYHKITAESSKQYTPVFAREIESLTANLYSSFIKKAQEGGDVRTDMDSRMLAFFFDNLLMTLQFSYCCDYYKERFELYCGKGILEDNEKVVAELLKFFESAFTTEQKTIPHRNPV